MRALALAIALGVLAGVAGALWPVAAEHSQSLMSETLPDSTPSHQLR